MANNFQTAMKIHMDNTRKDSWIKIMQFKKLFLLILMIQTHAQKLESVLILIKYTLLGDDRR